MILLLGAYGMLGRSLYKTLTLAGVTVCAPTKTECDITSASDVFKAVRKFPARYIINCAALRGVDDCEKDREAAIKHNADPLMAIGSAADLLKARLIHISTDYVFDGNKKEGSYSEEDIARPAQWYGYSKLLSEDYALRYGNTLVFRVQWLFGRTKPNFCDWVAESVLAGKKIPVTAVQTGSPSSCDFVAQTIYKALDIPRGIYHVAHDDFATRKECAEEIAKFFAKNPEDCFNWNDNTNFGIAKRPVNTNLNNSKLKAAMGLSTLGNWRDDVRGYLDKNYMNQ